MSTVTPPPSLEAVLKDEVLRMYQEIAERPMGGFHFHHGRDATERFGHDPADPDGMPEGAVASFPGVGNPHLRSGIQPGETVLDLGGGAGLYALIDRGKRGRSRGARDGRGHESGHAGERERPRRRRLDGARNGTMEETFRVLKPVGRISFTDIVSEGQLSQSIVNDPKLWAS